MSIDQKLVLTPLGNRTSSQAWVAAIGLAVLAFAWHFWLKDPHDYGRRTRGLEHFLTNQQIAYFFAAVAVFLIFAAVAMRIQSKKPKSHVLTSAGFHADLLFRRMFIPWSGVAAARDQRSGRKKYIRHLVLQDQAGKTVGYVSLTGFEQTADEIIAFIRKVRPELPINSAD